MKRHSSVSLLDAIENSLYALGRPATSKEIAKHIKTSSNISAALGGATPHKTVQARIAVDITSKKGKSRFYRYAPSTFALRALSEVYPTAYRRVYVGFDRRRQMLATPTLFVNPYSLPPSIRSGYFNKNHYPIHLLKTVALSWISPRTKRPKHFLSVNSFILLINDGHVLTFEPSKYDENYHSISQAITIGLHGHFRENDINLFDKTGVGFNWAVEREVHQFLSKFSGYHYNNVTAPQFLGFVRDDASLERSNAFGVVACVQIPRISVENHRLGYRNLNWRPLGSLPNDFVMFDSWSKYVFASMDLGDQ
ncbi:HB1, ASXL, restriction endonuclease HTH domain [Devosia enhydra]|uniref:HB1, ASXL, restriction endonuclease HTH domain n=1 Tax=Devosia enhydra TaxID=665118 RepID=A0A1K2HVY8_9HYPH|nr:winged helix-turn-helix domain-containing protein [Devosia enhydra]SFZ83009.1 HB1, ASXL, restriction endonuclease HTH domain [Devosia enhydra]